MVISTIFIHQTENNFLLNPWRARSTGHDNKKRALGLKADGGCLRVIKLFVTMTMKLVLFTIHK